MKEANSISYRKLPDEVTEKVFISKLDMLLNSDKFMVEKARIVEYPMPIVPFPTNERLYWLEPDYLYVFSRKYFGKYTASFLRFSTDFDCNGNQTTHHFSSIQRMGSLKNNLKRPKLEFDYSMSYNQDGKIDVHSSISLLGKDRFLKKFFKMLISYMPPTEKGYSS